MTIQTIKELQPTDIIATGGGNVGEITYNGFTFNAIRQVEMSSRVVYDDAGISAKFIECTMSVSGFIYGDDVAAQQTNMNEIHRLLNAPGKNLLIEGIGFDLKIETKRSGATPDLMWGAKPQTLQMQPIGGNIAWAFQWVVTFRISRCESANVWANRFLAFNYSVSYATNSEGLIERVIEGYLEIPQLRNEQNARAIDLDLEAAWDRVVFRLPVCFRRITTQRQLTPARNRLNFTIVDQELADLPYPNGIIEADADYDFENVGRSFESWVATLSAEMTVAPGLPRTLAATKFFLMLADKMASLRATAAASDGAAIPMKLRIGAKVFGRTSRFQAVIQVVACLKEILRSSGLWKPVPGTSYQQWAASMVSAGVWNPRGRGGWRHTTTQDAIVDVCTQVNLPTMGNDQGACLQPHVDYQNPDLCPPGEPYLHYENELHGEQSQNVVVHKISQLFGGAVPPATASAIAIAFPGFSGSSPRDHVAQYESAPDNYVIMIGRALRLSKSPDVPKLLKVGGVEVEEVARRVAPKAVASYFGCPLLGVRWAILYRVKGQIKTIKPPNNKKTLCFDKGEKDD